MKSDVAVSAIWLRREADHVVVLVEQGIRWVEVIREPIDGPFSHIAEASGIKRYLDSKEQT